MQKFSNNVDAVTAVLAQRCRPHNCLNYTNFEPSVRNQHSKMTCVVPYDSGDCANVTTWNPRSPVRCKTDTDADVHGVCGLDRRCYTSGTTFPKIIKQYKDLREKFLNDPTIAQFQAFNKCVCTVQLCWNNHHHHQRPLQSVQPWGCCCVRQGCHHLHGHPAAATSVGV